MGSYRKAKLHIIRQTSNKRDTREKTSSGASTKSSSVQTAVYVYAVLYII